MWVHSIGGVETNTLACRVRVVQLLVVRTQCFTFHEKHGRPGCKLLRSADAANRNNSYSHLLFFSPPQVPEVPKIPSTERNRTENPSNTQPRYRGCFPVRYGVVEYGTMRRGTTCRHLLGRTPPPYSHHHGGALEQCSAYKHNQAHATALFKSAIAWVFRTHAHAKGPNPACSQAN